jgi:hypothetical protein
MILSSIFNLLLILYIIIAKFLLEVNLIILINLKQTR